MTTPTAEELLAEALPPDSYRGGNMWPTTGERALAQRLADALAEAEHLTTAYDRVMGRWSDALQREEKLAKESAVARAELERLRSENAEMEQLFDMQHERSVEASKLWKRETGTDPLTYPDLGKLLTWFMAKLAEAQQREAWWRELRKREIRYGTENGKQIQQLRRLLGLDGAPPREKE